MGWHVGFVSVLPKQDEDPPHKLRYRAHCGAHDHTAWEEVYDTDTAALEAAENHLLTYHRGLLFRDLGGRPTNNDLREITARIEGALTLPGRS